MLSENIKAVKAAEAEAARMIADAKTKAQELKDQAEKDAQAIIADAEKRAAIAEKELLQLAAEKADRQRKQVEKETEEQIAGLKKQAEAAYGKAAEAVTAEIF